MGNSGDRMVPMKERFADMVEWMPRVSKMGVVHTIVFSKVDVGDNYEAIVP